MQSPLASSFHLNAGECILAVEGDRPIHPVLQHIGISAWPGELVFWHSTSQFAAILYFGKPLIFPFFFGRNADPNNTCSVFSEYQSWLW
jgi:hypothetical protein